MRYAEDYFHLHVPLSSTSKVLSSDLDVQPRFHCIGIRQPNLATHAAHDMEQLRHLSSTLLRDHFEKSRLHPGDYYFAKFKAQLGPLCKANRIHAAFEELLARNNDTSLSKFRNLRSQFLQLFSPTAILPFT